MKRKNSENDFCYIPTLSSSVTECFDPERSKIIISNLKSLFLKLDSYYNNI